MKSIRRKIYPFIALIAATGMGFTSFPSKAELFCSPQVAWFSHFGTPAQGQITSPSGVDECNPCSMFQTQVICQINGATAYADPSLALSTILRKDL